MTAVATDATLEEKLTRLEEILRSLERVLVGYSGGVDSALLAVAAQRVLGEHAVAVTAVSESYATGELEAAADLCRQFGIRHEVLHTRELENPDYASNPPNRCYFCKQELLIEMERLAGELGISQVIYGQNADDQGDFRPGAQAAKERGARAPLAEVGITKAEIRELARRWKIPVWDRPSMACLSSRFPYGTQITAAGLAMVDQAEKYLREVCGFTQLRSRHHGTMARIELPAEDVSRLLADEALRQPLVAHYKKLGYDRVTIDLRGFRSGSMNEVLLHLHSAPADISRQLDSLLSQLQPASWEQDQQLLYLQLAAPAFARLGESEFRIRLADRLADLGFRYAALDLHPLEL